MGGPTILVVNAGARQGEDADAAMEALRAAGVRVDDARRVEDPSRLEEELRAAVAARPARLLVGAGDGTLSTAANLLAGTEVALGVLPLGTGNDFARTLHIPRDLEAACRVIAAGRTRRVTVGVANGRAFLNALSFGLSSAVSKRLTPELKRRAGPLAYPVAAAGEAIAPEPFRVAVEAGRERFDGLALQVVVGNGRYHGGGTLVAPDATLEDDALDVWIAQAAAEEGEPAEKLRNAFALARIGLLLRRGRHLEHPLVRHLRCREATIAADPPQEVDADGELLGTTPVRCGVAPGLLTVLAPGSASRAA